MHHKENQNDGFKPCSPDAAVVRIKKTHIYLAFVSLLGPSVVQARLPIPDVILYGQVIDSYSNQVTVAGSVLKITDLDTPTTPIIQWSSAPFKTYSISRATNLLDPFSVIDTNIPATPPDNTYNDTNAPGPHFCLIKVE